MKLPIATPFIRIEFTPGDHLTACCEAARDLSRYLSAGVVFSFNGTDVRVLPLMTAIEAERNYEESAGVRNDKKR